MSWALAMIVLPRAEIIDHRALIADHASVALGGKGGCDSRHPLPWRGCYFVPLAAGAGAGAAGFVLSATISLPFSVRASLRSPRLRAAIRVDSLRDV